MMKGLVDLGVTLSMFLRRVFWGYSYIFFVDSAVSIITWKIILPDSWDMNKNGKYLFKVNYTNTRSIF